MKQVSFVFVDTKNKYQMRLMCPKTAAANSTAEEQRTTPDRSLLQIKKRKRGKRGSWRFRTTGIKYQSFFALLILFFSSPSSSFYNFDNIPNLRPTIH